MCGENYTNYTKNYTMQTTEHFKQTILNHLQQIADKDVRFAEKFANPSKNISDCITYILNTVQKSECNGFTDAEIYNMALHYYDEENIAIGEAIDNMKIVVNHVVELTDEEKQQAKKEAFDELVRQQKEKLTKKKVKTAPLAKAVNKTEKTEKTEKKEANTQPDLFS